MVGGGSGGQKGEVGKGGGRGRGPGLLRYDPLPSRGNTGVWNQCAVKCSLAAGYSLQCYPCTSESGPCLRAAHNVGGAPARGPLPLPRLWILSPRCSLPTLNALLQTVVALLTWDSSHTGYLLQQTREHDTRRLKSARHRLSADGTASRGG